MVMMLRLSNFSYKANEAEIMAATLNSKVPLENYLCPMCLSFLMCEMRKIISTSSEVFLMLSHTL